jgi:hypothetical protein
MKNSRRVCVAILLSAAMLFSSVVPVYTFGPITHGYIAEEVQPSVSFDGYHPDPAVFESGAIMADVMHLDDKNMHGNPDFWKKMLTMADKNDPEEQSFGASFICHGESDSVWATFIGPKKERYRSLLPGWLQWLTGGVGIEGAYKFLFDAYAVVERGYTPPLRWVLYPGLISKAYKAETGDDLSQVGLLVFSLGLRIATFVETVLIIVTQPLLKLAFSDLLARGAFYTVKKNFAGITGTAAGNTVNAIEQVRAS